jgi:hypothetical protein
MIRHLLCKILVVEMPFISKRSGIINLCSFWLEDCWFWPDGMEWKIILVQQNASRSQKL